MMLAKKGAQEFILSTANIVPFLNCHDVRFLTLLGEFSIYFCGLFSDSDSADIMEM